MRRFTILKKAIKKAHDNGYHFPFTDYTLQKEELFFGHTWWVAVIFSHDFAKAFWGEGRSVGEICGKEIDPRTGKCCNDWDCKHTFWLMGWQHHLEEMVLEEDPIKYLAKYL